MPTPHEVWEQIRSHTDPLNWVILGFDGAKKVTVVDQGTNGMAEMVPKLEDDKVFFAAFRVNAVDERGTVTSTRAKFVMVQWVGSGVGAMARGRVNMQRGEFENVLKGCHIQIQTADKSDLDESCVTEKLQASTGAHKPSGYNYNPQPEGDGAASPPASPEPAKKAPEPEPAPAPVAPEAEPAKAPEPEPKPEPEKPKEPEPEPEKPKEPEPEPAPAPEAKAAPPPPPPPPPAPPAPPAGDAPAPAAKAGGGMGALFAEISAGGENIAGSLGLKKVTNDMKNYKQVREEGWTKMDVTELEKRKEQAAKPAAKRVEKKGEPKQELIDDRRWELEWIEGKRMDPKEIELEDVTPTQAIYIYKCSFVTLKVPKKVNQITLVGCKRVDVCFQDAIACVEITKCNNINIQVLGSFPSCLIDSSSDVNAYLSKESLATEFTTVSTTGINITVPPKTENDDPKEMAAPEQFLTKIVDRKLVTTPFEHVD